MGDAGVLAVAREVQIPLLAVLLIVMRSTRNARFTLLNSSSLSFGLIFASRPKWLVKACDWV